MLTVAASIFDDLTPGRAATGTIWFLSIYAIVVWAARFSLAPQLDGWSAPLTQRALGAAALSPVLVLAVIGSRL
jgi:hypothetical protein